MTFIISTVPLKHVKKIIIIIIIPVYLFFISYNSLKKNQRVTVWVRERKQKVFYITQNYKILLKIPYKIQYVV